MYEIKQTKICITLDPSFYLCDISLTDSEIIKKATVLSKELDKVMLQSIKIIFHADFYKTQIDHINLFLYQNINDPILITLNIKIYEFMERIKFQLVATNNNITDLFPTTCENTKQILYSMLHYQRIHYYNRIIYSNTNNVLTINHKYYTTNTFDILSLDINALEECTKDNYINIISLYQWYFENTFNNRICISLFCINKISTLSISFNKAIISLFRSIYFPDYMYIHDASLIPNDYRIECHCSNGADDTCKITAHKKTGTYRFHVVPEVGDMKSQNDRMSYVKLGSLYIIVGISNCHEPLLFERDVYKKIESIQLSNY